MCCVVLDTDVYSLYPENDGRQRPDSVRSFRRSCLSGIEGFGTDVVKKFSQREGEQEMKFSNFICD